MLSLVLKKGLAACLRGLAQNMGIIALLAVSLIYGAPAEADMYVYYDENGAAHVSSEPVSDDSKLLSEDHDKKKPFSASELYVCKDAAGAYRFADRPLSDCYKKRSKFTWQTLGNTTEFNDGYYDGLIREISQKHDMEFALVKAVIKAESDFDSTAISRAGAQGLMQLMPKTAKAQGVSDPFDPTANIEGGVKLLAHLQNRYKGNLDLTLSGYNAGETAVNKYNGIPPFSETRTYIIRVRRYLDTYRQAGRL